jgi:hypothetical protein
MFDKSCFYETLLIEPLLVLEDLESYILSLLVIVTLEHHSEAAFSDLLRDFISVSEMLIHSLDVLVALGVKSVVGCFVKNAHVRLGPYRACVGSIELLLFPFLDGEEVNGFVFEDLSLLHVPEVRAENLKSFIRIHWKSVVVV